MSTGYHTMSNVAAHAAGQQGYGQNFASCGAPQVASCGAPSLGCAFAMPNPHRVYCQPAAFHRTCGEPYHNLSVAYGQSRPLERYY